jgi:hypothetical protein
VSSIEAHIEIHSNLGKSQRNTKYKRVFKSNENGKEEEDTRQLRTSAELRAVNERIR